MFAVRYELFRREYLAVTAEAWLQSLVMVMTTDYTCDDRVAEGLVLLSTLSTSFHQCSILNFVYMLVLLEGQTSEDGTVTKQRCFRNLGSLGCTKRSKIWARGGGGVSWLRRLVASYDLWSLVSTLGQST